MLPYETPCSLLNRVKGIPAAEIQHSLKTKPTLISPVKSKKKSTTGKGFFPLILLNISLCNQHSRSIHGLWFLSWIRSVLVVAVSKCLECLKPCWSLLHCVLETPSYLIAHARKSATSFLHVGLGCSTWEFSPLCVFFAGRGETSFKPRGILLNLIILGLNPPLLVAQRVTIATCCHCGDLEWLRDLGAVDVFWGVWETGGNL